LLLPKLRIDSPAVPIRRLMKDQIRISTPMGKSQTSRNWEKNPGLVPWNLTLAASNSSTSLGSSTRSARKKNSFFSGAAFCAVEGGGAGTLVVPVGAAVAALGWVLPSMASSLTVHSMTSLALRWLLNPLYEVLVYVN